MLKVWGGSACASGETSLVMARECSTMMIVVPLLDVSAQRAGVYAHSLRTARCWAGKALRALPWCVSGERQWRVQWHHERTERPVTEVGEGH